MTDIHNTLIQRANEARIDKDDHEIGAFHRGYHLGVAHGLEEAASLYLRKRVDEDAT